MRIHTMPISENLKDMRELKNLTQGDLAKLAAIESTQISRIERGTTQPKLETIKKLALALECTSDELIFDEEEKTLSRRTRELFEEVEKLNALKKQEILNVVKAYCAIDKINLYMREDEVGNVYYHNSDGSDYESYLEEVRDLDEREKNLIEKKASLEIEEQEIQKLRKK